MIDKVDDHFVFEFMGLDELTEQEKHEMLKEQLASYKTLNEVRRELDMPELDESIGEVPLNPNLLQLMQLNFQVQQQQVAQEQQQQQQQQMEQEQQMAVQGEEQPGEQLDPIAMQEGQLKVEQMKQKLQQEADRHPFEMELLKQKVAQPQMPGQGITSGVPHEESKDT